MRFLKNIFYIFLFIPKLEGSEQGNIRKCCNTGETLSVVTKKCLPSIDSLFDTSLRNFTHVPETEICGKGKLKVKISDGFFITGNALNYGGVIFEKEDFCLVDKIVAIVCVIEEQPVEEIVVGVLG